MNKQKGFFYIFTILLPFFLILLAYFSTFFITSLTENQQVAVDFLKNPVEYEQGLASLGAQEDEISHMYDVHNIMNYARYTFFALLLIITLLITRIKKNKQELRKYFLFGGVVSIIIPLLLTLFSLLSFTTLFTFFHKIFFPQGNWQFAYSSFLIQTFPQDFFQIFALKLVLVTLFYASIFIAISFYIKHDLQNTRH